MKTDTIRRLHEFKNELLALEAQALSLYSDVDVEALDVSGEESYEFSDITDALESIRANLEDGIRVLQASLPAQTEPEWIEWNGGDQPVKDCVCVEIQLRDGFRNEGMAGGFYWNHPYGGNHTDIVAYRVLENQS